MIPLSVIPGAGVTVAATGSSVSGSITMGENDNAIYITNTSTTLHVAVRIGTSAPTAVLTTDPVIPPNGTLLLAANNLISSVAAIGSGAGPTNVTFGPCTIASSF